MENQNIIFSISGFVQNNQITRYEIEIKTKQTSWKLYKRYSEFEELHRQLACVHDDLPQLPKKQLFHLNRTEIENRMINLDDYLKQLAQKLHIVNSLEFRNFFVLDQYDEFLTPVQIKQKTFCFGSIKEIFQNQNYTLVLQYDSSTISKLDTYIMNKMSEYQKQAPISQLICYKDNDYNNIIFKREFHQPSLCMGFNKQDQTFAIAFQAGNVIFYQLQQENNDVDLEEQFQITNQKINGIVIFNRNIFVIINNILKIQNTKKFDAIKEEIIGNEELTSIIHNQNRNILVISNKLGKIFAYHIINQNEIKLSFNIETNLHFINQMIIDNEKNYLIILNYENSRINISDFSKGMLNGFGQIKTRIEIKNKSTCFQWSNKRGELIIGNENGTISIWSAQSLQLIYVFQAHQKSITKMIWNESNYTLLTVGEDSQIKEWYFPKKWKLSQSENFITF